MIALTMSNVALWKFVIERYLWVGKVGCNSKAMKDQYFEYIGASKGHCQPFNFSITFNSYVLALQMNNHRVLKKTTDMT